MIIHKMVHDLFYNFLKQFYVKLLQSNKVSLGHQAIWQWHMQNLDDFQGLLADPAQSQWRR